mgnify:FL=1
MTLLHHETDIGRYCSGDCNQGRNCDCEEGAPVDDWFSQHPLLCAIVAVAVVVFTALASSPNMELFR